MPGYFFTEPFTPFSIRLENGESIDCKKCLRKLPGRRLTCSGSWQDTASVIKLYARDNKGRRQWRREQQGLARLNASSVLAPKLIDAFDDVTHHCYINLIGWLEGTETFQARWNANPSDQLQLLDKLIKRIASMHSAGIWHEDPHLENFLVYNDDIAVIDGDGIRGSGKALSKQASFKNLGLLLAQFTNEDSIPLNDLLLAYEHSRKWFHSTGNVNKIRRLISAYRKRRLKKYLQKIYRNSSSTVTRHSECCHYAAKRNYLDSVLHMVDNPDQFMADHTRQYLKKGNTSTVVQIEVDNLKYVIKRYNIKSRRHAIRRAVQSTRASRSWRNAHLLAFHNILTAEPVAYIERRTGALRSVSWFVMKMADGKNAAELFNDEQVSLEVKTQAAGKISEVINRLHSAGISHGDLKASNIIVTNQGVLLLDIDALRYPAAKADIRKDQQRLLKNWEGNQEILDLFKNLQ